MTPELNNPYISGCNRRCFQLKSFIF